MDNFTIDPAAGIVGVHTFAANSVYDPNQTATGHQPSYYDLYAMMYNQYVVLGSKITVHASSLTNAAGAPTAFGVLLEDDGSALTAKTAIDIIEQKMSRYGFVNVNANYNGKVAQTLTATYSAKKINGVTDVNDNIGKLGALVNTNPTDLAYFRVWAGSQNEVANPPAVQFLVSIEYIVQFSDIKEQLRLDLEVFKSWQKV